jgi:hypothetical protein
LSETIGTSADLTGTQLSRLDEAYDAIMAAIEMGQDRPGWLSETWLRSVARGAKHHLDRSFARWRELYQAAVEQRDAARREVDRPRLTRDERRRAEQREREAKRELELLLNTGDQTEADFYPYRYLAGEGFIPGYNFPRLPLRALVSSAEAAEAIDRPRFLGLSEFGPGNVIYHEGRRHRVVSCVVPAGGIEQRLGPAKLCRACGYVFPGRAAETDLCTFCKTELNGSTTDFPRHLFEQPTVRAARWSRISSEEEERVREGYDLSTHFRQSADSAPTRLMWRASGGGAPLLEATMIPRAELWRINHGWRRVRARTGFAVDPASGRWRGQVDELDEPAVPGAVGNLLFGVRPYITDYRNLLLLKPAPSHGADDTFLKTLGYALRRAIQIVYQVEEQELAVELIGESEHRRILLWEAAEGGVGIGERLADDPAAVSSLAYEALTLVHYDPDTGLERSGAASGCVAACYDCLLSYSNQIDHRDIDRRSIAPYLTSLRSVSAEGPPGSRRREEHYLWLLERIDPGSSLERAFLDTLFQHGGNLPNYAQYCPAEDVPVQVDFYYERGAVPGVCVFLDGPHHDAGGVGAADAALRSELKDRGFRTAILRHDREMLEQLREHQHLFFAE